MRFIILLLFLIGCENAVVGTSPTSPEVVAPIVETVVPAETPSTPSATLEDIVIIATKSKCISYKWKDRGIAPKSYIKGMAIAYAKEVRHPGVASSTVLWSTTKDALAHYGLKASGLNT